MTHIRHRLVSAFTLLPLFFLAGCASLPSKEEITNLDYGTCPQNYEATIKEQFKGKLLTRYSDELNIWPPQKHWYRTSPIKGNRLLAGYLVPVIAEQTFGPNPSAGKQLYGFIFFNDQMIESINPVFMQDHSIKEAVGPIPRDEREWQVGYSNTEGNQVILEYVIAGETVQNWSELVTMQVISNVSPAYSADKFVTDIANQHKSKNPGCTTVSHKILASTPTEILYEQELADCAPYRDEYSIRKAIRGPRTLTEVSYSKTTALSDNEKRKWAEIVGRTTFLNECQ